LFSSVNRIISALDNQAGKIFNCLNNRIKIQAIPEKLKTQLMEVGIDVRGKNARRTVLAAMNHTMQTNFDTALVVGAKLSAADPQPDIMDLVVDMGDTGALGLIKHLGFARSADAARTVLSFRHENLPADAQEVVRKYMQNPVNVIRAYSG